MKTKSYFALIPLLVCVSAAHANINHNEMKCPSVNAIIAKKFTLTEKLENGKWVVAQASEYYDTDNKWGFVVGNFEAENDLDAIAKVNQALTSLTYQNGPSEIYNKNVCSYKINIQGSLAVAVSPPCGNVMSFKC